MSHETEGEHFVKCLTLEVDKYVYHTSLILKKGWEKKAQTVELHLHTAWYNMNY